MQNTVFHDRLTPYFGVFKDYLELTRPRTIAFIVFLELTALVVSAPSGFLPVERVLEALLGGLLAAASAGVLTQYLNRDLDGESYYARTRPIPSGRIMPRSALIFGVVLVTLSALILGILINWQSAVLASGGAIYYAVLYNFLLKHKTPFSISILSVASALPVLAGWEAGAGWLPIGAFILFAVVLFWMPLHSWVLAVMINHEYHRKRTQGGRLSFLVPTFKIGRTCLEIVWYAVLLITLALLPFPLQILGYFYFTCALLLSAGLLILALYLFYKGTKTAARIMYRYSSAFLMLLFLAMILDRLAMPVR